MAKFKVGDKVKVIGTLDCGVVGEITNINKKARYYPFSVKGSEFAFAERELELVASAPSVNEVLLASGAVVASYETFEGAVLVGGTSINDKLRQYAKQGVEVEVVVRVKGAK